MRARERERVAHKAREVLAEHRPKWPAEKLEVYWVRESNIYGFAVSVPPAIFISEPLWETSTPAHRADTVAHELAHVVVLNEDDEAPSHGTRWRSEFRKLLKIAREETW